MYSYIAIASTLRTKVCYLENNTTSHGLQLINVSLIPTHNVAIMSQSICVL